ncbi:MAG TPA: MBL fold metallo-hydrolase [Moraxellaceae bacterium]|nr:MBL fold metallo-hydrolase [Moraxellaceae bacterium]
MSRTFELPTRNVISELLQKPSLAEVAQAPHFNGRRFFNPWIKDARDYGKLFNWLLTRERNTWPTGLRNQAFPKPTAHYSDDPANWKVWFVGHATLLLQIGPWNFLTDPVWSERCSPFANMGPKRARPAGIALEDLPTIHAVLLSHNHYDHLDLASLLWLHERDHCRVVTGIGNRVYLSRYGLDVTELDWWESCRINEDVHLHYVPARHFSGRGMRDRNAALWGGLSVMTPAGHAYFAGDTGYAPHFREIRERLGAPRVALLPIGAYEPRELMREVHMNPLDAVMAHQDLQSVLSIGMHFNTFQLTDESIDAPVRDLGTALARQQVDPSSFITLAEGSGLEVPPFP